MSQVINKFVSATNPLDDTKIKLRNNNNLKARNAADSGDVSILKVNASDRIEFASMPKNADVPAANDDLVNKLYVDGLTPTGVIKADGSVNFTANQSMNGHKLTGLAAPTANGDALRYDMLGANSGIATLDSGGKVPVTQLPNSVMEYKGTFDPTGPTPALADGTGNTGDVYRVTVAGSYNFGSGSITFVVGDYAIYNGSIWEKAHSGADAVTSVNGSAGAVTVNAINQLTSEVTAGPASGSQSVAATVVKDAAGAITNGGSGLKVNLEGSNPTLQIATNQLGVKLDSAGAIVTGASGIKSNLESSNPTLQISSNQLGVKLDGAGAIVTGSSGVKVAVDAATIKISTNALKGLTPIKQLFTLSGTDITNQYIDLSQVAIASSIDFVTSGLVQTETVDYTVNLTGGAGSKTRLTFAGDLATAGSAALVSGDVVVIKYMYL